MNNSITMIRKLYHCQASTKRQIIKNNLLSCRLWRQVRKFSACASEYFRRLHSEISADFTSCRKWAGNKMYKRKHIVFFIFSCTTFLRKKVNVVFIATNMFSWNEPEIMERYFLFFLILPCYYSCYCIWYIILYQ